MKIALLADVLLLISISPFAQPVRTTQPATGEKFNPYSYIPRGSKVPDPAKDVVFADLEGNGSKEAVILYLAPNGKFVKPSIKVLQKRGRAWQETWRTISNGGQYFIPPSGVYDMLKTGRPQIISYIAVGASCGGLLGIYEFDPLDGAIQAIGSWPKGTCVHKLEVKDLDGDGTPEIIFTETNYGTIPHIYWWNGEHFDLSDSNFPDYYNPELRRLVKEALERNSPARLMWGRMAFQIYMLQHRYGEAIEFCQRLLSISHSRASTGSPSSTAPASETADATSAIFHRWMGEAYKSLNQLPQARREFEMAQALDIKAKHLDPNHLAPFPLK